MNNIIDWILSQMCLMDTGEEHEEAEQDYKLGVVCIYSLCPAVNPDAQGMMNYICGDLYALGGDVSTVGENVFMATARKVESGI